MKISQHTATRWTTKNNLDIQNHAKTNQPSHGRKTRIHQQNNTLKTNISSEKFVKNPIKTVKTTTNNYKTKQIPKT